MFEKTRKLISIDIILLIGYLMITFLWSWDLQSFTGDSNGYTGLPNPSYWIFLTYSYPIFYFFYYILPVYVSFFWLFYAIHLCFAFSFYYVSKKLRIDLIWIFASLLMLPVFRYGILDYGCRGFSLPLFFMVWIYYSKHFHKKAYYILSIVGFFVREYCLFINLFFIVESFVSCNSFRQLFSLKNIKTTIKERKFEIMLCISYFMYRSVFTAIGNIDSLLLGMFNNQAILYLIQNPKYVALLMFTLGFYFLMLFKYPNLALYLYIAIIIMLTSAFGLIWELEKIGSALIVVIFELNKRDGIIKQMEKA